MPQSDHPWTRTIGFGARGLSRSCPIAEAELLWSKLSGSLDEDEEPAWVDLQRIGEGTVNLCSGIQEIHPVAPTEARLLRQRCNDWRMEDARLDK
jgi:hypothetical protein